MRCACCRVFSTCATSAWTASATKTSNTASQIGEAQWAPETPCLEIGDLLTGKATLERGQSDITVFDLTGLALQDLTVARLVHDKARTGGKGVEIHWPW